MADHPDLGAGHVHHPGHRFLHGVDALGRFPQGEPVSVPLGHATVKLDRRVQFAGGAVILFHHLVGLGKARFHVAPAVVLGLDFVSVLVDLGRARFQGLSLVGEGGEDFVVHLYRSNRIPGPVRGFGGHGGHGLALEFGFGVEERPFVILGVGPFQLGFLGLSGDDGVDALHFFGGGGVHGSDLGVGVGAADDGGVEHVGPHHVGGVDRRAGEPLEGVHPGTFHADNVGVPPRGGPFAFFRDFVHRRVFHVVEFVLHAPPPFFSSAPRWAALTMWE